MTETPLHTGWILTSSGRKFFPLDPDPEQVFLGDIAHHLSNLCRFTGAVRTFYSVAQHSVLVSRAVEADPYDGVPQPAVTSERARYELALSGLFHDGEEAYLIDLPRPLKHLPEMLPYRRAAEACQRAICQHFGLVRDEPRQVKHADRRILRTEQRDLMPPPAPGEVRDDVLPYTFAIEPWTPTEAREAFTARYHELQRQLSRFAPQVLTGTGPMPLVRP